MNELEKYRELELEYEREGFAHIPKCILLFKYYLNHRCLGDARRFATKLISQKKFNDLNGGDDKLLCLIRLAFKL